MDILCQTPNVIIPSYMIDLSRIETLSFITLDTSAEDSPNYILEYSSSLIED